MSGTVCIDASVAVKSALPEADSELARALLTEVIREGRRMVAPRHFEAEVTSAVHKRCRDGLITSAKAHELLDALDALSVELVSLPGLAHRALDVSAGLDLKYPYDAFHLAIGELLDCEVWTADARFHAAASPGYGRLRLLSTFVPASP